MSSTKKKKKNRTQSLKRLDLVAPITPDLAGLVTLVIVMLITRRKSPSEPKSAQ